MVGISELAKSVAKKAGVSQKQARAVIKAFVEEVVEHVNKGEKVNLVGFGIFERRVQKARKARNPRTKEIINVPEKKKFTFRASSKIKYL
ncbi:DNA-binding protein [Euryarchaeota archaeon ex4484_178]|nr:HU family DNA-binding protein [Thermoplasmata archaeon]OYT58879.1 MAG: DNA-binding protein [Euryarchaeota archaeon ex4484_178]